MISFMKKFTLIIINILTLSSCGVLFDDPIERFWNNGVMSSKNEIDAYSLCVRKSKEMYPQSIDPDGSERVLYTRTCMEQKGYW
ncbi:hypothetical protein [uncultured Haemophilus sp.]|uniref:hypothetical protein n=1 Tax=uncultured Haemophilus sp. TaxID=237779 RepID=UPI002600892D|nr:hypothetical protein [uncultured Haemophilus sp.]